MLIIEILIKNHHNAILTNIRKDTFESFSYFNSIPLPFMTFDYECIRKPVTSVGWLNRVYANHLLHISTRKKMMPLELRLLWLAC